MQKHLKNELRNIISGKSKVSFGAIIQTSAGYLDNGSQSGDKTESSKQIREQETKKLESFVTQRNLWINDIDFSPYVSEGSPRTLIFHFLSHIPLAELCYLRKNRSTCFGSEIQNTSAMDDLVKLLTDSSIIVSRIAHILEENNITGHTKDNVESARVAGFGVPQNSVELYVRESDAEKAQKIIEEFNKENASQQ